MKKQESGTPTQQPMREIIIKTDGNIIRLEKAEVAGMIELKAILQSLIGYCDNPPHIPKT